MPGGFKLREIRVAQLTSRRVNKQGPTGAHRTEHTTRVNQANLASEVRPQHLSGSILRIYPLRGVHKSISGYASSAGV